MSDTDAWWKSGVIYQIYPRSFMDANNDGIGDLAGITSRLPYVADLGVDAIWLSPFFKSPMRDYGYDVSDYRAVDPLFGTFQDFQQLVDRAHQLGLKVIIDQVLSHTSDEHAWFEQSRQDHRGPKSDWYVWADPKADGSPPNNWLSMFGGPAWTWEPRRRQYYLHNFLSSQPDLNFHNADVRAAQLENVKFWLDAGVDGFRLDVVNFYYQSAGLESNPPSDRRTESQTIPLSNPYSYQRHLHDISQPENVEFLRSLRRLVDQYPDRILLGEVSDDNALEVMAEYTSGTDKLHTAYTFELLGPSGGADFVRSVVRRVEQGLGDGWACWALSNHDVVRCPSRWGQHEDIDAYARVLVAMLLSLRGTICLYQGEELGLPEADVPYERLQDPYGRPFWPAYKGRDGCRTPMVWDSSRYAGFSSVDPWLPIDPHQRARAVHAQDQADDSCLKAVRSLLRWRREQPALLNGTVTLADQSDIVLSWVRTSPEQSMLTAFNLTDKPVSAPCPHRVLRVHDVANFSGRIEDGQLVLGPYQALFADIEVRP